MPKHIKVNIRKQNNNNKNYGKAFFPHLDEKYNKILTPNSKNHNCPFF